MKDQVKCHGKKIIFLCTSLITLISILLINVNSFAKVTGECFDCHTMHNSQNGTDMIIGFDPESGPYEALLRVNGCLGCHAATDGSTWQGIGGAPIVYNSSPPQYGARYGSGPYQGLAGGNFYWVTIDDNKGHNVFSGEPDDVLTTAPGGNGHGCGTNNSCHVNLDAAYTPPGSDGSPGLTGRQGCTGCHMLDDDNGITGSHHADDPSIVIDSSPWYRFLQGHQRAKDDGVSGIEDPYWQYTSDFDDHNEYLGEYYYDDGHDSWGLTKAHTMTAFCSGCHGNFHIQEQAGVWIRHPSDAVIPNSGEYSNAFGAGGSGTGTYDPDVPVARPDLTGWSTPSGDVNLGTDLVMCLSCHRPHGSPYPDMLRWNYDDMVAGGGGSTGCFVCHTEKDDS